MTTLNNIVVVYTEDTLQTIIDRGGSGDWRANKNRLDQCEYIIVTHKNNAKERGISGVMEGAGFMIGRISKVAPVEIEGQLARYVLCISQYANVYLPGFWRGQQNPVAYTEVDSVSSSVNFEALEWIDVPQPHPVDPMSKIPPLTVQEAKVGIAKKLGIDPETIKLVVEFVV